MIKSILIFFISAFFLLISNPVYSADVQSKSLEKYISRISNKFSKTYCNTTKFGISNEGAIAFAIGETIKEFKNNKLNNFIDYAVLNNNIIDTLEKNCQVYNFPSDVLDQLELK